MIFAQDPIAADHILTWAQVAMYLAIAMLGVVWAISHLFKTMTGGYGSIISALQVQNTQQQKEITESKEEIKAVKKENEECRKNNEDCLQKHHEAEQRAQVLDAKVSVMQKQMSKLQDLQSMKQDMKEMVAATQDLSEKVDKK